MLIFFMHPHAFLLCINVMIPVPFVSADFLLFLYSSPPPPFCHISPQLPIICINTLVCMSFHIFLCTHTFVLLIVQYHLRPRQEGSLPRAKL